MRKVLVVLLLLAACKKVEDRRPRLSSPPPKQGQAGAPVLQKSVPKPRAVSTPAKCAGDGSYDQAVECFRMSSGFRFTVVTPTLHAKGELQRPRIGEERVTIGEWTATAKPGGIVWTRGGKPAAPSPELERLYQRLTLYLDPQKKEGQPQLVGSDGKNNHYHFTDANSGEAYDVMVAKDDGHITALQAGTTKIAFQ